MTATSSCSACSGRTTRAEFLPKLLSAFLLTTSFLVTTDVFAQTSPGAFELTPYGGFRFGGTFEEEDTELEAKLDDDATYGLILNIRESGNTQWEIIYSRQDTAADVTDFSLPQSSVDLSLQSLQVGGTYMGDYWGSGERVRPYLAATIGGTHIDPDDSAFDNDTFWSFSVGGGLQFAPSNRVGLRLEARGWATLIDSSTSLFCSSGPQGGLCAIEVEGRMLWQFETFAGVVFRF